MYIRNYTYSAEDVDCKFCTEVVGRKGCRQEVCPYYAERIEAGVISYAEAILSLIPPTSSIRNRLPKLICRFPGSLWADKKHKTRMEVFHNRLGYIKSRNTPSYYAVLYLLTSNDALYRRTANCFHHGGIDFSYAVRRGISPHNYALLYAAKGLRHEKGVTESELADPEVIDEEAFRLIMNALLIAKYGTAAFHEESCSAVSIRCYASSLASCVMASNLIRSSLQSSFVNWRLMASSPVGISVRYPQGLSIH